MTIQQKAVLSPIPHFPWGAPCFAEPGTLWGSQGAPKEATTGAEGSLGRRYDPRLLLAAAADPRLPYPKYHHRKMWPPLGEDGKAS